jgi:hypothetical protein
MNAYLSMYIVIALLPLCKFCAPVMLSLLITKSTVKVHPIKGHEGPRGQWRYTYTLYLSSALDGVGGQCHALTFTPRKDLVPIEKEAGWALGPVWTVVDNLAPTGIRSPDHPAHSMWKCTVFILYPPVLMLSLCLNMSFCVKNHQLFLAHSVMVSLPLCN